MPASIRAFRYARFTMPEVTVRQLDDVAAQLHPLGGDQMRVANCFEGQRFTQGVIALTAQTSPAKQIAHQEADLLCYVISGTGRLRSGTTDLPLKQGTLCHIPAHVPHDFQATGDRELVLLFTLVEAPAAPAP
ncbi:MAG TPA: cupin domain-containing protein [Chloroflexota bacterium]|nr:cupin domain-containing protein [Chloroflexota bacterium]